MSAKDLNNIPKKDCFKTPDGYFEQLTNDIETKVQNHYKPKNAFEIFKPYIYMAACILGLVTLLRFGLNLAVDKHSLYPTNNQANATESNMIDILVQDESLLYSYLIEDETSLVSNQISNDDIEEYLSLHHTEYELNTLLNE